MQALIHNRRVGYSSSGEGPPLLLLHGFPLDRSMFSPQLEGLSHLARLITVDVPGVGASAPGPVAMDDIADLAADLLTHLEIERAVVGGVSMGGYAALAFARRHPSRLRGLVLCNTRAAPDDEPAKRGRRLLATLVRRDGPGALARRMLSKWFGPTTLASRPEVIERVLAIVARQSVDTIVALLEALHERPDATPHLGRIAVPVLVLSGDEDPLAGPQPTALWAAKITGAHHIAIAGAGHLPNLETPAACNAEIEKFLNQLDREPQSPRPPALASRQRPR